MANRQTSARHLRELLVHRIASGQYTIGSQLPGTRELAIDVGANRNTVAKVYGELAREGLLQIVAGRGAFVVGRVDATPGQEPIEQVTRLLDDAISRARLFGLSHADFVKLTEERIRAGYEDGTPRVSFIECNPYDARLASGELATQLGMPIRSMLYTDIPEDGPIDTDIAATSFFHLAEVDRMLNGRGTRVIGVNMLPDSDALLQLARLPEGTKAGLIATNESGITRSTMLVRTYCRAEIRSVMEPSDAALDELAAWSDVLVSSLSCSLQVHARAAGRPVIVIAFHVDPQSAQYLRSKILTDKRDDALV